MPLSTASRHASHAGSWYTDDNSELDSQLSQWLAATENPTEGDPLTEIPVKGCKAIIGPHAGYSYSGPAAAFAYRSIDVDAIKRVFVLGPSHHFYLDGCALSQCDKYETPIGDLPLDRQTIDKLHATGRFELMDEGEDEEEHSIEMHLPYIRKVFENRDISIVPILVGSVSTAKEISFGSLLAPYLADPSTFFIISSDFAHWGTRFRFTHYHPPESTNLADGQSLSSSNFSSVVPDGEVWRGIEKLDRLGMEAIQLSFASAGAVGGDEKLPSEAHSQFASYLKATKNTICGRHPIGVLLGALSELEKDEEWKKRGARCEWVRYEQSSKVRRMSDSSVSYASAFVAFGDA
ncbi:hypothetical protein JCM11641_006284 [Rhodosporidiobolus odoratus]